MNLTQPAVSRRLQNFEASLGSTPLLDRSAKPPVLTPLGRRVLEGCRRVLASIEELRATASPGAPRGEMRIGVAHGLADLALSGPLDELRRRYSQVQLKISADWTVHLVEELRSGALDCAIALVDDVTRLPAAVASVPLGSEELVVVAGKPFSLPNSARGRLKRIAGSPWILNPRGCGYRAAVQRAFDQLGLALDIGAEVFGHDLQLSLVARGAGLTIVPRNKLETSPHRRALKIIRLHELETATTIALLRGGPLGSLTELVDLLGERVAERLRKGALRNE